MSNHSSIKLSRRHLSVATVVTNMLTTADAQGAGGLDIVIWIAGIKVHIDGILHGLVTWGIATAQTITF